MLFLKDTHHQGLMYLLDVLVLLVFKIFTVFKKIYFCTFYLLQTILCIFAYINYFFTCYLM